MTYHIEKKENYKEWTILLLNVFDNNQYQTDIRSNLIAINNDNRIWIAESPKTEKNDSYYDFIIYDGTIYAPTFKGLHHEIDMETGIIIKQLAIK